MLLRDLMTNGMDTFITTRLPFQPTCTTAVYLT